MAAGSPPSASIELRSSAPLDRNCHVMADRQRLKQVLLNLLTNAVKYTPLSGKVKIFSSATGSNVMRIVVSDTGAGILPEKLARIVHPVWTPGSGADGSRS